MTRNYFAIERDEKCFEHVYLKDNDNNIVFEDFMNMSYEDLVGSNVDGFVVSIMDASNELFCEDDGQTVVTLIDENDVFVWSIIIIPGDGDLLHYQFIDWKKDGCKFRYQQDE